MEAARCVAFLFVSTRLCFSLPLLVPDQQTRTRQRKEYLKKVLALVADQVIRVS